MTQHRFATSVAEVDTATAPPESIDAHPLSLLRRLRALVRGISGLDAYDRYLEHHRRIGCDAVLSEAEFWKSQWAEQERNPKARCC